MAQYQHLPIYKLTYDLLSKITLVTAGFSKNYKYSLGEKLRAEVVDLVVGYTAAVPDKIDNATFPL